MERLLGEDGCPWDRAQTLETLKPYLIEEAYEVLESMDHPPREHCEELGDLLFQIVFHAALRRREGAFDIDDVIRAIAGKMVRRHPHVFAGEGGKTAEELHVLWAQRKAEERREKQSGDRPPSALDGVPRAAPALLRAWRLGEKASRVGFDWPDAEGPRRKVLEELEELGAAVAGGDAARMHDELGDLLFAVVNLGRKLELDPEEALRAAIRKFERRFRAVEERLGGRTATAEELDRLWEEAKDRETG